MCGICGVINLNKKPIELPVLQKMNDTIAHRGPDDEGIWVNKNIGLAQRRLSILDLSSAGHQPMFYDGKNLAVVFNGEIYNYIEIRQELSKKGYRFKSDGDTEVILAAYKEWGPKCLERFNGMWAFALYDKKNDLIFAARDRMGVKPFYYLIDKQKFLFASEIKAIVSHPEVRSIPNEKIVWDYLIAGILDHSEETFFKGIHELRGGYFAILNLKNKKLKITKYWDLDPSKPSPTMPDKTLQARFQELFIDSVRLRLRSDVPIGTCLSGGLDSSAIVCVVNDFLKKDKEKLASSQVGAWQKTFSAAYDSKKYKGCDERPYIESVVKKTKAKSHLVFPSGKKLVSEIQKLVWHQDYPFCSTSIYAQWNVFRLAKENGVKVMLDGQGSDELLAGYHDYFGIYFTELLKRFSIPRLIYEVVMYSKKHKERSILAIFRTLFAGLARRGILGKFFQNKLSEYEIFTPEFRSKYKSPVFKRPSGDFLKDGLYNHLKYSITSLLRYEDRDSMAFAIESRVPFLDYRFVEFVFSLADNQKIRHGETKWIMREALKGILPEKIRKRQDKIGFATPEEYWFHEELGKDMKKVFASDSFNSRGIFENGKALELFEDYLKGNIKNYSLFWRLYNYEIWMRTFID